jgi:hypothetical protein
MMKLNETFERIACVVHVEIYREIHVQIKCLYYERTYDWIMRIAYGANGRY